MKNDDLVSSRKDFNEAVYTPLSKIEGALKVRRNNKKIDEYLKKELQSIPPCFTTPRAVLSRSVATYNFEMIRFLDIAKDIDGVTPLVWEYHHDKFTPDLNLLKKNLAKMTFEKKTKKQIERKTITDFDIHGKKFFELKTSWGDDFISFHHSIFPQKIDCFDATEWYAMHGKKVGLYYKKLLCLFLRNAVMFENFLIKDSTENPFIKEVFLPAFLEIERETGYKPLITVLEHPEDEGLEHWMYYPEEILTLVKSKLSLLK